MKWLDGFFHLMGSGPHHSKKNPYMTWWKMYYAKGGYKLVALTVDSTHKSEKKVHQRKSRIRLYSADSFLGQMKLIRRFNKMLSTPKNLSKCCSVKWSKFIANFPWENVREKKQTCTTHHLHSFNCKFNRFGHCF